jgi:hypothetical protein
MKCIYACEDDGANFREMVQMAEVSPVASSNIRCFAEAL